MGLITTMGQLRILQCDRFDCNKKVESRDEGRVKDVALLSGWELKDDRWICPNCVKKEGIPRKSKRYKEPTRKAESTL